MFARDVTVPASTWGNRLLPILDPSTNVFPLGGGIGQGLAMGIGAATARPEVPTVVIAGDGGLAVHLGELATLAQQRPHLVLVVFNDGGYGVLRTLQEAHGKPRAGVDLHTPDFGTLAAALGLDHQLVTAADRVRRGPRQGAHRARPVAAGGGHDRARADAGAVRPARARPRGLIAVPAAHDHRPHHHAHGPANRGRVVHTTAAPLFVCEPAGPAGAAVVAVHGEPGIDAAFEAGLRTIAADGALAVAPYLYFRDGGPDYPAADRARAAFARLDPATSTSTSTPRWPT